jgi:hypothetical protein
MFTKIRALPDAIELAIMGEHFRKVAKDCEKSLYNFLEEMRRRNTSLSS